ncbi:MAG: DUF2809 domain-containing protein [Chloroflexota bacterium]
MPSSLGSMPTKRRRIVYLIAIAVLFLFGLPSRLVPQYLPDFYVNYVGDGLWAMAIFFLLGFVFPSASTRRLVIASLAITYAIEFSELYQADWINQLRSIKLIGLILGFTFLWSDLAMYTIGIAIGALLEHYVLWRKPNN